MRVYVLPLGKGIRKYYYNVMVDDQPQPYDTFESLGWLTQSQMNDVADGYKEGLENYDRPN